MGEVRLSLWGVRLEEMLIATPTGAEILTEFPIEEITVCG
jgi:Xaa-Pro aminopeptidase